MYACIAVAIATAIFIRARITHARKFVETLINFHGI